MGMQKKSTQFKQMFRGRKATLSMFGVSARFDWLVILGVSLVVFVGLLFMSWQLYVSVATNSYLDETQQVRRVRGVDQNQLDRVVDRFKVQQERFSGLAGDGALRSGALLVEQEQLFDIDEMEDGESEAVEEVIDPEVDFDQSSED